MVDSSTKEKIMDVVHLFRDLQREEDKHSREIEGLEDELRQANEEHADQAKNLQTLVETAESLRSEIESLNLEIENLKQQSISRFQAERTIREFWEEIMLQINLFRDTLPPEIIVLLEEIRENLIYRIKDHVSE